MATSLSNVQFTLNGKQLDFRCEGMCSLHQERLSQRLAQIFPQGIQNKICHIELKGVDPVIKVDGKVVDLPKEHPQAIDDIRKIVRYCQHLGDVKRTEFPERLDEERAVVGDENRARQFANTFFTRLQEENIPGNNNQILAGTAEIADDTLGLIRNRLYATAPVPGMSILADHLGYYAAGFWLFRARQEVSSGWSEYERAVEIGDQEGYRRAQTRLLSGGVSATGVATYLASKVITSLDGPVGASNAVLSFANAFFGIGSLVAMASSASGVLRCYKFNSELSEYLPSASDDQATKVKKYRGALQFLKDQILLTPEQLAEIDAGKPATQEQVQQRLSDLKIQLFKEYGITLTREQLAKVEESLKSLSPMEQVEKLRSLLEGFFQERVPNSRQEALSAICTMLTRITESGAKESLRDEKISNQIEANIKYLKRRTSRKSIDLMLRNLDTILWKLDHNPTEGIQEAESLIRVVQKENQTKMVLYILGFIAALLSLTAQGVATFYTGGGAILIPYILYGVSGGIYTGVIVYNYSSMLTHRIASMAKSFFELFIRERHFSIALDSREDSSVLDSLTPKFDKRHLELSTRLKMRIAFSGVGLFRQMLADESASAK